MLKTSERAVLHRPGAKEEEENKSYPRHSCRRQAYCLVLAKGRGGVCDCHGSIVTKIKSGFKESLRNLETYRPTVNSPLKIHYMGCPQFRINSILLSK